MAFVIDASATLPWHFEDEATPWTEALLNRLHEGEEAIVPAHWPIEVINGLLTAARRGRISTLLAQEFAEDLATLPIRIEVPSSPAQWPGTLKLAWENRLTAYDAAYLELAHRIGLALATLDRDLQKAAKALGVWLLDVQ